MEAHPVTLKIVDLYKVFKVLIVYNPWTVTSPSQILPGTLEHGSAFSMTIRGNTPRNAQIRRFNEALAGTKVEEIKSTHQVCFGIILFGKENKVVFSLFMDAWGKNGFVNGKWVKFSGGQLLNWFKTFTETFFDATKRE